MYSKLTKAFVVFCVATLLAQLVLTGYIAFQGGLNAETATKVLALINGIDISGEKLQQILRESEDGEQPDFDEILEARTTQSYDMDMRLRSQKEFRDEITLMLAELREQRDDFDQRLAAFRNELKEIREGAEREGLAEVQRTLQSLDANQAKEQLLIMYEDERIDEVVTIIQAIPTDKRKDILAEFVSKDEADKLAEILRRISKGMPTSSLIDQANEGL